ncbi:porin [Sulfitobacter sabulilitoris]|uniref:Porin n=1 Tax=Sulfitobacter sabulilitoris TaxID=2562655 RepID=A0A5S3PF87_9RHOB|nr:porin [Sulfitobacter sabulilitoris]TMM52722.1 hypothetical protein FDT80_10675 [Sulfitobacter sabulilitoris]
MSLTYIDNDFDAAPGEAGQLTSTTAFAFGNLLGEVFLGYTDENSAGANYAETTTIGLRGLYEFSDSFAAGVYAHQNLSDFDAGGTNDTTNVGLDVRASMGAYSFDGYFGANEDDTNTYDDWTSLGLRGSVQISNMTTLFLQYQRDDATGGGLDFDVDAVTLGATLDLQGVYAPIGRPVYVTGEIGRWSGLGGSPDWTQIAVTLSVPFGNNAATPPAFRGSRTLYTEFGY